MDRLVVWVAFVFSCVNLGCKPRTVSSQSMAAEVPYEKYECSFAPLPKFVPKTAPKNIYNLPWDVFLSLAMASDVAYESRESIIVAAISWGFTKVEPVIEGNLVGFVASNDRCAIVAFRGTDEIRDWFTNGQLSGMAAKVGRLHSGFAGGFARLKERMFTILKAQGGANKQVWVTGHSLGGALAGVFAYENAFLKSKASPIVLKYIVTFGQPLFADAVLAAKLGEIYRGRYFRIVNEEDVVVRVPPGYKHFGSLTWFHNGAVAFYPQLSSSYGGSAEPPRAPPSIPPGGALPPLDEVSRGATVEATPRSVAPTTESDSLAENPFKPRKPFKPNSEAPVDPFVPGFDESADSSDPNVALEPKSEEDFAAYMEQYKRKKASPQPMSAPPASLPGPLDGASRGIPQIDDHSVKGYARNIRKQITGL